MSRKVTVIGAGNVGATIAYTLSLGDIASQIVVVDINREKVEGEVMDIVREPASASRSLSLPVITLTRQTPTSSSSPPASGAKPVRAASIWRRPTSTS